ncbi:MAG: PspC domain-containing protein [Acidimicrobiia bacterium]
MSAPSESRQVATTTEGRAERRLYRSKGDRMIAGVAGGLGTYFGVDPVWFRIAFVVLAVGGGSGVLVYLVMWIVMQPEPGDYERPGGSAVRLTGAVVLGTALMAVGVITLVNSLAPSLGQYFWPVALVLGGLALVFGGVNRDNDR